MTVITKYHDATVTVHLQLTQIADNASDNMRPQKGRGKNKANINIVMQRTFKATHKAAIAAYTNELIAHERSLRGTDNTAKTSRSNGAKNIPGV